MLSALRAAGELPGGLCSEIDVSACDPSYDGTEGYWCDAVRSLWKETQ